jgi:hypothetical protein
LAARLLGIRAGSAPRAPGRAADLVLTVAVPELVDPYRWHEHVAERLQPVLQSLPPVVITSVPFHLAD